MHNAIEKVSM